MLSNYPTRVVPKGLTFCRYPVKLRRDGGLDFVMQWGSDQ